MQMCISIICYIDNKLYKQFKNVYRFFFPFFQDSFIERNLIKLFIPPYNSYYWLS